MPKAKTSTKAKKAAAGTSVAPAPQPPAPPDTVPVYVGGNQTVLAEHHSGSIRLAPGRNDVPPVMADHLCGPGFGSAGTLTQRGVVKLFPVGHEHEPTNEARAATAEQMAVRFAERNANNRSNS